MKYAVAIMIFAASITLILCEDRCSGGGFCPPNEYPEHSECCQYFKPDHCCTHETNKRYKQIFITVVAVSIVALLILVACIISVITCSCCALSHRIRKTPTTHMILNTGYTPVPHDGVINNMNTTYA